MNRFILSFLTATFLFFQPADAQQKAYSQYVNPFIGTGGAGHTFPGAVLPFGMVQLSPDTRVDGTWEGCSGYHHSDSVIYGFTHTHLSGTGCSDWGDILLMPITGETSMDNKKYASSFSHKNEKASPGFYEVVLDKYKTKVELTTTLRTGIHRYTFPSKGKANVILDLLHRDKTLACNLQVIDSVTVSGHRISEAWAKEQHIYFVIKFSKPFKKIDYAFNKTFKSLIDITMGERAEGASFEFDLKDSPELMVKVAISPVSTQGAMKNMQAEATHFDFNKYKTEATQVWDKQLSKMEVTSKDKNQSTVFYTALYHCFIHPSLNMDVDNQYRGRDNQIHKAEGFVNYSVFSLWDTYRAQNPLLLLLEPKRSADFINTFLVQYQQSGRLPMWELSGNETDCMIGFHSVPVIADALVKGMKGIDVNLAYEAMKAASNYTGFGIPEFNRKGFLQVDDEHESVSKTLEYGYDNWCIAQVARIVGKRDDIKLFMDRSLAYSNLFDASTGFMRPRKNGNWLSPFYPAEINNHFTEGNSWQYSFYVPHDIEGLIRLHGGKENFEKKLDELFTTTEKKRGRDQADVTGLIGQYAHGNEPSHHMAYLYNYVGKPNKTVQRVQQICSDFYKNEPDGLIGNEDCGQMSAWYVFSSMGLYPVCPGTKEYDLGTSMFEKVAVYLENGDTISIASHPQTGQIMSGVMINKRKVISSGISHNQLAGGCDIEFLYASTLDSTNRYGKRGRTGMLFKTSLSRNIPAVIINSDARVFKNSASVKINAINTRSVSVYYTLDGTEPTRKSTLYQQAFTINNNCIIKAKAYWQTDSSVTTVSQLYKLKYNYQINVSSVANPQYAVDGTQSLMDGIYGSLNWHKGEWLGYSGQNFECVVDMLEKKEISSLSLNCLQDTRSWIVFPKQVSFFSSDDGKNFALLGQITTSAKAEDYTVQINNYKKELDKKIKTRYIKIVAEKFGKLPDWHAGKGDEAFIFVDELEIK